MKGGRGGEVEVKGGREGGERGREGVEVEVKWGREGGRWWR